MGWIKITNLKGFWALEPTYFSLKTPLPFNEKLKENDIVFVQMGFGARDCSYTRIKVFSQKYASTLELSGFFATLQSQWFSAAIEMYEDNIVIDKISGFSTGTLIISIYVLRI